MVIDILDNCYRYTKLHKLFKPAFEFLRKENLKKYCEGRYDIAKNDVYALISKATSRGKTGASLEAHRKYIDIQVALSGEDLIGYKPLSECRIKRTEYDAKKDCVFFNDKSNFWFKIQENSFAIFFPQDAHAPLAGSLPVLKAVIKVRV
ncbi:MAG: YhcH/YjgK/YiaL family protein [Candidatus Omnitrophica bacterium]|jgi:beta-galactosidase beta subunit|nr:YhcH/YjgK/YiaL family protein [Candidatus Omnitrophota bacterium]